MAPSRSRDRYEDDETPRHSPGTQNTAIVVLAIIGIVLFFVVVGVGTFLALGARGVQQAAEEEQAREVERQAKEKSLPTRDEFRAKVMGKTTDEVTDLVGKPDSVAASGGAATWTYRNVSRDPVTGKTDGPVSVHFRNGRVEKVDF